MKSNFLGAASRKGTFWEGREKLSEGELLAAARLTTRFLLTALFVAAGKT